MACHCYDFNCCPDRHNTSCRKYDQCKENFGRDDVLPMGIADADYRSPPEVLEAIKEYMDLGVLGYCFRSSHNVEILQNWVKKMYHFETKPEWYSYSPGIVPAVSVALAALFPKGSKVMLHTPCYSPFLEVLQNNGYEVVRSPMVETEKGYTFNWDEMDTLLAECKSMILCNPHNPTGTKFTREELRRVADLAEKHDILVMSDEIHADFIYDGRHCSYASVSDYALNNSIVFMAPSKTFNVAGLTTSYIIIANKEIKEKFDFQSECVHVWPNSIGLLANEICYTKCDEWYVKQMEHLKANRDFLVAGINKECAPITVKCPSATFLLWLDCRNLGVPVEELTDLFSKHGLGLAGGDHYDGPGFMRLNYATSRANCEKALECIKAAVASLKK